LEPAFELGWRRSAGPGEAVHGYDIDGGVGERADVGQFAGDRRGETAGGPPTLAKGLVLEVGTFVLNAGTTAVDAPRRSGGELLGAARWR
jgi:hypothetical protein